MDQKLNYYYCIHKKPIMRSKMEIPEIYEMSDFKDFSREELPSIIGYTFFNHKHVYVTKSLNVFMMKTPNNCETYPFQEYAINEVGNMVLKINKEKLKEFVDYDNSLPEIPEIVYNQLNILKSYCDECLQNILYTNSKFRNCSSQKKCLFLINSCMIYVTQKNRNLIRYELSQTSRVFSISLVNNKIKMSKGLIMMSIYETKSFYELKKVIREPLDNLINDSVFRQIVPLEHIKIESDIEIMKANLKQDYIQFNKYKEDTLNDLIRQREEINNERKKLSQDLEFINKQKKEFNELLNKYKAMTELIK